MKFYTMDAASNQDATVIFYFCYQSQIILWLRRGFRTLMLSCLFMMLKLALTQPCSRLFATREQFLRQNLANPLHPWDFDSILVVKFCH